MYSVFAAELMIWSIACMAKLNVMNSTIGFSPANAAPTPMPAKPCSVIGVSITRLRAELLQQSLRDLVGALVFGDFLAHHEHITVAPHLFGHGIAQGFAHGHRHHLGAFRHVRVFGNLGCWARSQRPAR